MLLYWFSKPLQDFQSPPSVSQKVPVTNPFHVPQRGLLWRELPVSSAFFYMSLEFLGKSSPNKKKFHPSLEGPKKGASPHGPQNGGPIETGAHFQSLTCHILGGPQ